MIKPHTNPKRVYSGKKTRQFPPSGTKSGCPFTSWTFSHLDCEKLKSVLAFKAWSLSFASQEQKLLNPFSWSWKFCRNSKPAPLLEHFGSTSLLLSATWDLCLVLTENKNHCLPKSKGKRNLKIKNRSLSIRFDLVLFSSGRCGHLPKIWSNEHRSSYLWSIWYVISEFSSVDSSMLTCREREFPRFNFGIGWFCSDSNGWLFLCSLLCCSFRLLYLHGALLPNTAAFHWLLWIFLSFPPSRSPNRCTPHPYTFSAVCTVYQLSWGGDWERENEKTADPGLTEGVKTYRLCNWVRAASAGVGAAISATACQKGSDSSEKKDPMLFPKAFFPSDGMFKHTHILPWALQYTHG